MKIPRAGSSPAMLAGIVGLLVLIVVGVVAIAMLLLNE